PAIKKIIFLIGATGAQGQPVIKALLEDAEDGTPSPYAIRALTRDPEHRRAKELEQKKKKKKSRDPRYARWIPIWFIGRTP
ncbi:hypothetical protein BS47DRAFT_1355515, partial [Hydnum rufescens UP504]